LANDEVELALRGSDRRVVACCYDAPSVLVNETAIEVGRWYHVALVVEETRQYLLLNGELDSPTRNVRVREPHKDLWIGNDPSPSNRPFAGQIDEVRLWNRALSQQEIRANMGRRLAGSEAGLMAYYPFDERLADGRVADRSGNGNHGKLVGGARLVADTEPLAAPLLFDFEKNLQGWLKSEGPGQFLSVEGRMYHQGPKWTSYYYPALMPASATYEFETNIVERVWGTSLVIGLQEGFVGEDLSFRSTRNLDGSLFVTFNTSPLVSRERLLRVEYIDGDQRRVLHESPSPFGRQSVRLQVLGERVMMELGAKVVLDTVVAGLDIRAGYMSLKSGDGGSGDWFDEVRVAPLSELVVAEPEAKPEERPKEREPTPIADPSAFHIASIRDVPNDQGKQVRLTWVAHVNDRIDAYPQVTNYSVWRRFDLLLPSVRPKITQTSFGDQPAGEWTFVTVVPAKGVASYSLVAPTLADSTARSGLYYSHFFVTAHTEDPIATYDTVPDSGYSVDNWTPPTPRHVAGMARAGEVTLVWEPVSAEILYYAIYRGTTARFATEEIHALVPKSRWAEVFKASTPFYRVEAVSFSGSRSLVSEAVKVRIFPERGTEPEDFDEDGEISLADFFLLADALHTEQNRYDLDGDGIVGMGDFLLFIDGFGRESQ